VASFYLTGPILLRRNIYTVIFNFNTIKARVKLGLGLRVRVRVFADVFYGIFFIIIIQRTCVYHKHFQSWKSLLIDV